MVKTVARYVFLSVFLLVAGVGMYCLIKINQAVYQPLALPEDSRTLLVAQGETLTSVVNNLEKEGVIRNPKWLLLFAKLQKQTSIRAGEYELQQGLTGETLLQRLASGRVIQYQVTFIEGSTLAENMKRLSAEKKLINDIENIDAEQYRSIFGFTPSEAEGWFFPDTYTYVSGMKISDVLRQAHNRMRTILDEEWQKRANGLPYQNPHEALVMASIVEKETGAAHERKQIAGVFVRRMKLGMKLQTDPTVIYGLGKNFTGDLKRSHLKEYSPWNTYVIDGLPPTPIAWPSREAINAALNPAQGNALFFVAKGDGTHIFSETLAQHENAVNEYQMRRKANYQSLPPVSLEPSTLEPSTLEPTTAPEGQP
ncbi:MAG: endolytic transglycosylase MltG [Cellvibrionales bacterium]|nr:endolytic transglycosylase MltG [Cellvibrionales bacterium]